MRWHTEIGGDRQVTVVGTHSPMIDHREIERSWSRARRRRW
ncbi:MAG: hypothetical protein AVDCRST_MAG70-1526 [uncultured Thermomicrobiales bacterium]|uniref:Uncharacterized protein n=1 Tax=uncultured Thermomicrobiales bacterium TaxID=1645740 RepID=A0A6J4UUB4_9BACT|nr:MAG: hypothetical protein AVDCRST_MAG70-1526 [uncultured Thermomicrobiales bacterium]